MPLPALSQFWVRQIGLSRTAISNMKSEIISPIKINDKALADKHYEDGPLFTLINGKFTPQRDGLCGFYKLLSPLRGKLKVCMPRYLLTEYGFQPGRVDTRPLIIPVR